ncbi:MAG: hypothetical protein AB7E32_17360 [Desulfovibrio sp.]
MPKNSSPRGHVRFQRHFPARLSVALVLLSSIACLFTALALAAGDQEGVELHIGTPDFFAQATSDGVPPDFLSSRSVTARIVQYNRPLVDMLSETEGKLIYVALKNGHALHRSFYSPGDGRISEVEYRFVYHPETKDAELTDILVNGKLLDNYDFYDYADELCRPARP